MVYETITDDLVTIEMWIDDHPMSPQEWDNLAEIVYFGGRYILGYRVVPKDWQPPEDAEVIPVQAYIHGNVAIKASHSNPYPDPMWDSGQCGYVWVSHAKIIEEYGRLDDETIAKAREVMRGEVKTFSQYLSGDVWGFTVKDNRDDEILDGCGGIYGGLDYAKKAAQEIAEYQRAEIRADLLNEWFGAVVERFHENVELAELAAGQSGPTW